MAWTITTSYWRTKVQPENNPEIDLQWFINKAYFTLDKFEGALKYKTYPYHQCIVETLIKEIPQKLNFIWKNKDDPVKEVGKELNVLKLCWNYVELNVEKT